MREIKNCRVAVIGGAGFLGSHLVDHLIEDRGCDVLVLDNLISGYRKFINEKARFEWCDITGSEHQLKKHLEGIDYVFNYAAEPYIPVSFERPLHVFDINAFGALKVMNVAHELGVKGILQVSSAEIYGNQDGKINEDSKVEPHSTYGAAKAAIDNMVQVRWREAQTPAIAMRQFNCYGPRETHRYVIPEIIDQLAKGNGDIFLGNNSFRDFQYAKDAVRMAVELLEKGQFGEVYNMGSEDGIKIYDLAFEIGKIMNKQVVIETDESRVRPWEIWHLQSDNTKLYSVIDTRPVTSFQDGLKETVRDYETNGWAYENE